MNFEIRKFDPSLKTEILALSYRSWQPVFSKMKPSVPSYVYGAFYPEGWWVRQASEIVNYLDKEGDSAWVAAEAQSLLGWVGTRLHPEDKMGEIHILAVDPDHHRRGIGSALIAHAIAHFRQSGMQIVMVETGDDPGHAPSRATYERAGFERWPVARYFKAL